jgi:hypothetical protein
MGEFMVGRAAVLTALTGLIGRFKRSNETRPSDDKE